MDLKPNSSFDKNSDLDLKAHIYVVFFFWVPQPKGARTQEINVLVTFKKWV